jgi:hypothetical protein
VNTIGSLSQTWENSTSEDTEALCLCSTSAGSDLLARRVSFPWRRDQDVLCVGGVPEVLEMPRFRNRL